MKSLTRTRAIGGSLMVTIPKEIVREENIRAGELVEIEVNKPRKSFFGIAKGVGPFTKGDEMESHDWE